MKLSELAGLVNDAIVKTGDGEVFVSIDVSTGDADAFRRAIGRPIGYQIEPDGITFIAEGSLNE